MVDKVLKPKFYDPLIGLLVITVAGLAGWNLIVWSNWLIDLAAYEYELDYGEGIVWQQALMLARGDGFTSIKQAPHVVFHYPPVFHWAMLWATPLFGDGLLAGRFVSLASTALIAILVALFTWRYAPERTPKLALLFIAALAGFISVDQLPMVFWPVLMRVDMLGIALALLGALLTLEARQRPWAIHLAVLFFTLAVFTKQTNLALPIAAFAVLIMVRPKTVLMGVVSGLIMSLGALAYGYAQYGAEFFSHLFLYNINRWELANYRFIIAFVTGGFAYVALAIYCAIQFMDQPSDEGCRLLSHLRSMLRLQPSEISREVFYQRFLVAYLLISLAFGLLIGKSGANVNYLLDMAIAVALAAGFVLAGLAKATLDKPHQNIGGLLVLVVLAFQIGVPADYPHIKNDAIYAPLNAYIAAEERPILSDEMVWLLRHGQEVLWEAAIFAELEAVGVWDPSPIIAQLDQGFFGGVVTVGERGTRLFKARYSEAMADAIDRNFPEKVQSGHFVLHLPSGAAEAVIAAGAERL